MSVKEELNSGNRIPSQWTRSTVADGSWLQKYTLTPLSARDDYLAEQIDCSNSAISSLSSKLEELSGKTLTLSGELSSTSSFLSAAINYVSGELVFSADYLDTKIENEISARKKDVDYLSGAIKTEIGRATSAESALQNQIDLINASTDVINVYGSWSDFTTNSGQLFSTSAITDKDIIKVINDPNDYPPDLTAGGSHQTYHRWNITAVNPHTARPLDPSEGEWNYIGYTDPYYNVAEIDEMITTLSGTISNTYLSAKGAVHQGKNIVVTEDSTKPEITISTSANVEFTNVSSTNISATNVTALTATGNSAKFTNLSSTNLTSNNISSTKTTATTAYITNLNGASKSDTVDNLFGSAYSGAEASAWINENETKIAYTADFKGTNGVVTGYGSSAFAGGISSISAKAGNSTALFTGYNVNLQAGAGVGFSYGTNLLTISAEGKTYSDGDYIRITGDTNKINVTGTLLNSAQSGQSAYNWITTKSATLSAGPGIGFVSAGPNILGISAAGTTYSNGRCIEIDNNKINLSSTISADNIIMSGVDGGTHVSAYYSPSGIHLKRAGQPGPEVYLTPFDISSVVPNGHMSSITSTTSWDALMNSHYVSAATQPLTFSSAPPNIVPSEMIDNVIYLI